MFSYEVEFLNPKEKNKYSKTDLMRREMIMAHYRLSFFLVYHLGADCV